MFDLGLAFTSALLLLEFDIKHAHELVSNKLPCKLVSCEHKVMYIAPLLAVISIFEVRIYSELTKNIRLRPSVCPRSELEVAPSRLNETVHLNLVNRWLVFKSHILLSIDDVVIRLVKVCEFSL